MLRALKNNAAAGYKGSVKIELLTGAGLRKIKGNITSDLKRHEFEMIRRNEKLKFY